MLLISQVGLVAFAFIFPMHEFENASEDHMSTLINDSAIQKGDV